MKSSRYLEVYRDYQLVGYLHDETPIRFEYSDEWLNNNNPKPISPTIPVSEKNHNTIMVEAYFENLLPESGLRELLKLKYQVSTVFGLLSAVGADTAGALSLILPGEKIEAPSYEKVTWEQIKNELDNQGEFQANEKIAQGLRISLAGAQRKRAIFIMPDGSPAIPSSKAAPCSYILKPDIIGLDKVWSSAINETYIMKLAAAINLDVAEAEYQPIVRACLIKRYDRFMGEDGFLKRLPQWDLCQLDGKPSNIKYENDNGPSLKRCRELLQHYGVPASDLVRFLRWIFFNLYTGNHDSHAKNISIYYDRKGEIRLTPFYDLLCTKIYTGLTRTFAFKLGGNNDPLHMSKESIEKMAKEMGFKPKYVSSIGVKVADEVLAKIDHVAEGLSQHDLHHNDSLLLERLCREVKHNTQKVSDRLSR